MNRLILAIAFLLMLYGASAQPNLDSLAAENTLEELFTVCNSVLPDGETPPGQIIFDRVAPYILYIGSDASRNYKSACDYNKVEDRKVVDKISSTLKNWLEQISEFKVINYKLVKVKEGDLHTFTVSYKPVNGGVNKTFSFIKVKDKFLLLKME